MSSIERGRGFGSVLVRLLGIVIALIGLTLTIGGGQLIMLGGSAYYLIVGLLMIVSGGLLALLRPLGAWLYIAIFIATVVWALWEVGLNGWALVPRVVAPLVLLIAVVLSLPALKRDGGGGKLVWGGLAAIAVFCLVSGVVVAQANKARVMSPVPSAGNGGVGDPAVLKVGADWPAWGGSDSAQRYSPLSQINKDNVKG
ncbi:MAG TPA: membrane-bound PQQ-dependent dehydrogenase, glucose/quinate/shikimate family, partial [Brevundimonas sp.]|nr:membrane-bound PQQ-dependent dehydrogenase, glucose/quinate/shikimate family [Brevundimonas sp.]